MGAIKRAGTGGIQSTPAKAEPNAEPNVEQVSEGKPRRSCLHKQLHKTKFCMYHLQGVCQFGDNCAFAHSCLELQGAPDLRKTRLCNTYATTGSCKDHGCSFAHGEEELRSTDMFYKKTLCIWYEKGRCRNGDQCRFAHGLDELRCRVNLATEGLPRRGAKAPASNSGRCGDSTYLAPAAVADLQGVADAVNGQYFEPMFVQPQAAPPQLPSHAAFQACASAMATNAALRQMLSGSPPSMLPAGILCPGQLGSAAQSNYKMALQADIEKLSSVEKQMEQLARSAPVAGSGECNAVLQTDLEKLSENIASLTEKLNRFEQQMQKRTQNNPGW